MQWFGQPWPEDGQRAPICEDEALHVPIPIDYLCLWCQVPMDDKARGVWMPTTVENGRLLLKPLHLECQMRMLLGGPAHPLGACTCNHPDAHCDPDLGMEPRQAALAVWNWLERQGKVGRW